jgi:hypothetical protein
MGSSSLLQAMILPSMSLIHCVELLLKTAVGYWECLLHVSTFATTRVALPTGVKPG